MRRILISVGIGVVVLIVGLFIAVSLIDVNQFRPQIEAQVQKSIHRQVALGNMSLHFLPLVVKIESLSISEDPAFGSPHPFATASDVTASAGLISLLRGAPKVKSIQLNHPQIEMIRNAAGEWNFTSMTKSQNSSDASSNLRLQSLKIADGQVAYTDAIQNLPRAVYDHIGMEITDFAPNKSFGLNLNVHFPGIGKQLLTLKSKVGPIPQQGSLAATPVDGQVSLEEVTLSGFSKFAAGALPPNTDGTVSGNATLRTDNELLTASGNLKLANATVKGSKLDYPIEATFDLSDNRLIDQLTIKSSALQLGTTSFSFSGVVDSSQEPMNLDVKVGTKNASITDLAKLAGSLDLAFNPTYQVTGQLTADVAAKGPFSAPQLSGSISGRNIAVSGGEIKESVQVSSLDLALSPESIVASPFTAQSGSTRVDANFTASNYTSNNMMIDASLRTGNADIAELVNMAKAYGADAAKGMSGTGRVSLNVHVQGPISQSAKLNYAGSGTVSGATMSAPGVLTKPVSISSANLNFAQNLATVSNLVLSVGSTSLKGNLSVKDLAAPQVSFQLAADKISTAELQQLTAVPKNESAATHTAPLKAPQPSLLSKTTGSGTLSAGTIIADDLTLTDVHTSVKLNKGIILLSPLTANLYGGKESGSITLDTRQSTALCLVNAKLAGVDANSLLTAVSSAKDTLSGSLSANSNVSFALLPAAELPRTLSGTFSFNVANGELKRVNVLNEISQIARFLNPGQVKSPGNTTKLTKLSSSMNIRNGEASTNDLVAAIDGGSLSGKGTVNLASQALAMDVNAVLANSLTQTVGGTQVGGFLSTALANNKGELVVPVKVSGSLQKPVFAADASAMAQMKLKNLLPTTGNPTAGVVGALIGGKGNGLNDILNGVAGGARQKPAQPGQAQQRQQKPEDVIKGLLNSFGKKKQ